MTKGQWIEYIGSDEQIAEILEAEGWVYRNDKGYESNILASCGTSKALKDELDDDNVTHYLICTPHPLRDMICRQADTGQPVYYKYQRSDEYGNLIHNDYEYGCTCQPNWDYPNTEYSFVPFEEK